MSVAGNILEQSGNRTYFAGRICGLVHVLRRTGAASHSQREDECQEAKGRALEGANHHSVI